LSQNYLGLAQVDQLVLAKGDLGGQLQPLGPGGYLGLLTLGKLGSDFSLQLLFTFQQALIANRLALGGIGMDLAPIQTDIAQL
jgi:hypothetical protein